MNRETHRIEVLCLQGCPHAEETTRLVRDVASRLLQVLMYFHERYRRPK
jgi:hypothetical protein